MKFAHLSTGLAALGLVAFSTANAAPSDGAPQLVSAYAEQLALMCPPTKGAAPVSPDRVDLNSDGLLDWVFDSGRQSCASTSTMAKTYGSLVTIFLAIAQGEAEPALQQAAYGAHLERIAGKSRLILTLGGTACGEQNAEARCDRLVSWSAGTKRLELATSGATPAATAPR